MNNFWLFLPVSAIELFIKGIFIGILVSVPMGPVGILCVQRTLQKGRIYGLVTGLGATLSDIFYALATGFGMSFAMDFITNEQNLFYMQLLGSVLLLLFGIYMFKSKIAKKIQTQPKQKGTLVNNFLTAFLLTFANPLICFLFMGLFARFAFLVPTHFVEQTIGFLGIITGALSWWFILTYGVDKLRAQVSDRIISLFNKTIGGIIIAVAIIGACITLFKLNISL